MRPQNSRSNVIDDSQGKIGGVAYVSPLFLPSTAIPLECCTVRWQSCTDTQRILSEWPMAGSLSRVADGEVEIYIGCEFDRQEPDDPRLEHDIHSLYPSRLVRRMANPG